MDYWVDSSVQNTSHNNSTMRLGKANVHVSGLLGKPYGTVFEVQGKQLAATANAELYEDIVIEDSTYFIATCLVVRSMGNVG